VWVFALTLLVSPTSLSFSEVPEDETHLFFYSPPLPTHQLNHEILECLSHSVRFLDNFSAGTRGATSAEYFLSAGYAVIFMHRQHSLSPYTRHYSHTTNPFLDLLGEPQSQDGESSSSSIQVLSKYTSDLSTVLSAYHATQKAGTLLRIPFVTVNEYLFMLREMSKAMKPLGRNGLYYLAAAVSDFFVPSQKTVSRLPLFPFFFLSVRREAKSNEASWEGMKPFLTSSSPPLFPMIHESISFYLLFLYIVLRVHRTFSRSTRFNLEKVLWRLKWIKFRKSSNQWFNNGLQKAS